MKIITNHHNHDLFHFHDFSDQEQQQLRNDYDWMESDLETNYGFFRYKNSIYHLQDFTSLHGDNYCEQFKGYDGVLSDSYFSGVLIKLNPDNESIKIANYFS